MSLYWTAVLAEMNRMADQIFQNESATKNPRFSQPNRALVPIFTEEFMALNKARETELKQLRKSVTEMEEQGRRVDKRMMELSVWKRFRGFVIQEFWS